MPAKSCSKLFFRWNVRWFSFTYVPFSSPVIPSILIFFWIAPEFGSDFGFVLCSSEKLDPDDVEDKSPSPIIDRKPKISA